MPGGNSIVFPSALAAIKLVIVDGQMDFGATVSEVYDLGKVDAAELSTQHPKSDVSSAKAQSPHGRVTRDVSW